MIRSIQIQGEEGAGARAGKRCAYHLPSRAHSIGNQAAPHYGDAHQFYNAARKVHTNKLLVGSSFVDPQAKDTHQPHGCVRSRSAAPGAVPLREELPRVQSSPTRGSSFVYHFAGQLVYLPAAGSCELVWVGPWGVVGVRAGHGGRDRARG